MKNLYFRLVGGQNHAEYIVSPEPETLTSNFIEVRNVPDDALPAEVCLLLNKTVIWETNVVDYSQLGAGKVVRGWGGKREGAGRPATGRKRRYYYVTDEEHETLTAILREIRGENK